VSYIALSWNLCSKGGWDVKEHRVYAYEPGGKKVRSAMTREIVDGGLGKGAQEAPCWLLAQVYKDAYYGGDSFQFSQAAQTKGYYHKIIWDLNSSQACCEENYPGGFNDCISSHYWIEHHNLGVGLWARPVYMKVWKHANRQGPSQQFNAQSSSEGWRCYDYNWSDEYWGVPPETINDKVSSIDMFYEVAEE